MKKALCIISLLFFNQLAYSQAPVIEWQNTIGGTMTDNLTSLSKTSDGGYICGGPSQSDSTGDKTENSVWGEDYWVIKLDDSGNIQWQNTIGGTSNDLLMAIIQTSDGGYICGGYSNSNISGDKTENCIGDWDFWIIKLDQNGNILWQNTIGGSDIDILYSISQTIDGGYICGGPSRSGISGDKTENSNGDFDFWVIKLDPLGNIEWQNSIGGSDNDNLIIVSQITDNGYICGGISASNSSGDKIENSKGGLDYWVVKLDSSGSIQWQNTIGGSSQDNFAKIIHTIDGGFICGGYSFSNISGDKTENSKGENDYWIVKLDSIGIIQWQNTIGGGNYDNLYSIEETVDGGYFCVGSSDSDSSGDKSQNSKGGLDFWMVKLDVFGNIQWQNSIGGNSHDFAYSLSQTNDGGYISGLSSNSNISGDKTENSYGYTDLWIIKLSHDYNTIFGKLFYDINGNAIQDNGEPSIKNSAVFEVNSGRFCFSDINGNYSASVLASGNYTVTTSAITYFSPVPANYSVYFSGLLQTDSLNDFALQPTGAYDDLRIKLTPLGAFRPGQNAFYRLDYQNIGTTNLIGDVVFYIDTSLNYISSTSTPTSLSSDSIVWNTGMLTPFQSGSITVTVQVKQTILAGTLIHSFAKIFPITTDVSPQNNVSSWEVTVSGSFDPNDILVSRPEVLTTELPSPPWLEYIIRFQNTGTDTAFIIKVLNTIDTNRLDLNSFEFEASSHPVNINYNYFARRFEFSFPDILLPDSNTNEQASHGFIRYRIKPLSTLNAGDSIKNKAAILFDFNAAVETNIALTRIVLPMGISALSTSDGNVMKIFPNPASETITIQLTDQKEIIRGIKIHDLLGRTILERQLKTIHSKPEITIDISALPNGIYILEVSTSGKLWRSAVVKQ